MSKARIRKLEKELRIHEKAPCRTCRGIRRIEYLDEFVTDNTPGAEVYYRRSDDDGEPTPPCPECGGLPFQILVGGYQPTIRPRGMPLPDDREELPSMTLEESDAWRVARGEPAIFGPGGPPLGLKLCEQAGL
jgi:hypothetical protein